MDLAKELFNRGLEPDIFLDVIKSLLTDEAMDRQDRIYSAHSMLLPNCSGYEDCDAELYTFLEEAFTFLHKTTVVKKTAPAIAIATTQKQQKHGEKKSRKKKPPHQKPMAERNIVIVPDTRLQEARDALLDSSRYARDGRMLFRSGSSRASSLRWVKVPKLSLPGLIHHHAFSCGRFDLLIWGGSSGPQRNNPTTPMVLDVETHQVRHLNPRGSPITKGAKGSMAVLDESGLRMLAFEYRNSKSSLDVLHFEDVDHMHWGSFHPCPKKPEISSENAVSVSDYGYIAPLAGLTLTEAQSLLDKTRVTPYQIWTRNEVACKFLKHYLDMVNFSTSLALDGCGCPEGNACFKSSHYAPHKTIGMELLKNSTICTAMGNVYIFGGYQFAPSSSVFKISFNNFVKKDYEYIRFNEFKEVNHVQIDLMKTNGVIFRCEEIKIESGAQPIGRYGHAMCTIPGSRFVIVGGKNHAGATLSDIWTFSLIDESWTEVTVSTGFLPPIYEHRMLVCGQYLVIFGGYMFTSEVPCNNLFAINLNTWAVTEMQVGGDIPPARVGHSFTLVNGTNAYLIGGSSGGQDIEDQVYVLENCNELEFDNGNLTKAMQQLLDRQDSLADFTFFIHQEPCITAHRIVLYVRCPFLRPTLTEGLQQFVVTANISAAVLKKVILYLYIDEIELLSSDATEILQLARLFHLEHLECICQSFVDSTVLVPPSTWLGDMQSMLTCNMFTDITFFVQGTRIDAHRCILVNRSAYFETMLSSGFSEAQSGLINDDETPVDVFMTVLKSIYYDERKISLEVAFPAYCSSNVYLLPDLKAVTSELLVRYCDDENACLLLSVSHDFADVYLENRMVRYVALRYETLRLTSNFLTLEQTLLDKIVHYRKQELGVDTYLPMDEGSSNSSSNNNNNNIDLTSSSEGIRNDPNASCPKCKLPYVFNKKTWTGTLPVEMLLKLCEMKKQPLYSQECNSRALSVVTKVEFWPENSDAPFSFETRRLFTSIKDARNQVALHAIHYMHM